MVGGAATQPARAGTLYTTDLEAMALGQGGAFVAAPTTLGAVWYNPAGLAWERGLRLELEAGIISSPLTFDRTSADPAITYDRVENREPLLPAGLAGVSYDLGRDDLAVGLFAYVPSSNNYDYDPLGAQRFQGVGGSFALVFLHAAVAYRVLHNLALGVALGPTFFTARQDSVISVALFGDPEDDLWSVPIVLHMDAPPFLSGSLGVSYRPWPALAVGASVMPAFDVHGSGHVDIALSPFVAALATVHGNAIEVKLRFPTIARLGVRWWPRPDLSVELAGVYEGWSRFAAIDVEPMIDVEAPALGIEHLDLPPLTLEKRYRDVVSVRLGGEGRLASWLTVRGGAFFESSGSSTAYFDVTAPDADKLGLTLGATVQLTPALHLDLAYGHTFVPDVEVTDSQQKVLNVIEPTLTRSVGNGLYRFSFDTFHLALRLALFARR